jgi:hypothetical protein
VAARLGPLGEGYGGTMHHQHVCWGPSVPTMAAPFVYGHAACRAMLSTPDCMACLRSIVSHMDAAPGPCFLTAACAMSSTCSWIN